MSLYPSPLLMISLSHFLSQINLFFLRQWERNAGSSSCAWVSVCPCSVSVSNFLLSCWPRWLQSTQHQALKQKTCTDYLTSNPNPLLCKIKPLKGRKGRGAPDFEPVALGRKMDRRIRVFNNCSCGLDMWGLFQFIKHTSKNWNYFQLLWLLNCAFWRQRSLRLKHTDAGFNRYIKYQTFVL